VALHISQACEFAYAKLRVGFATPRIRKLYNECKEELGPAANSIVDEKDIPPDSELGQTWGKHKTSFTQHPVAAYSRSPDVAIPFMPPTLQTSRHVLSACQGEITSISPSTRHHE